MAYTRTTWVESETPLSAQNMNNIEDGIEELQSRKVDKVSGKDLSDQNYTAAEKSKLAGIEAGAEVNVQSDWNQTNTSADDFIKNKPGNASSSAAGFMSAADKSKLDGVQAGAQVNPGTATTSANGLMSSADKTKLNGIAAGAQVNPVLSEVVATCAVAYHIPSGSTAQLTFDTTPLECDYAIPLEIPTVGTTNNRALSVGGYKPVYSTEGNTNYITGFKVSFTNSTNVAINTPQNLKIALLLIKE